MAARQNFWKMVAADQKDGVLEPQRSLALPCVSGRKLN